MVYSRVHSLYSTYPGVWQMCIVTHPFYHTNSFIAITIHCFTYSSLFLSANPRQSWVFLLLQQFCLSREGILFFMLNGSDISILNRNGTKLQNYMINVFGGIPVLSFCLEFECGNSCV